MILVDTQGLECLFRRSQVGLRILLGVLGLLQCRLRDCAMDKEVMRARVRHVVHVLVIDRLTINIECSGNVRALDFEQQLAFPYCIVQPGLDFYDAPVGQ